MPQPSDQAATHQQVITARRNLGHQVKAWRMQAGLSQTETGNRAGYSRATVINAEHGTTLSRPLYQALDQILKAGGRLLAARDHTAATIATIRQQATQQARAAKAHAARLTLAAANATHTTTQTATCPHCHHITTLTLTAHPSPETQP